MQDWEVRHLQLFVCDLACFKETAKKNRTNTVAIVDPATLDDLPASSITNILQLSNHLLGTPRKRTRSKTEDLRRGQHKKPRRTKTPKSTKASEKKQILQNIPKLRIKDGKVSKYVLASGPYALHRA